MPPSIDPNHSGRSSENLSGQDAFRLHVLHTVGASGQASWKHLSTAKGCAPEAKVAPNFPRSSCADIRLSGPGNYGGPKRRSQIWASFSGSKLRLQTASVALNRQRLVLGCCPPQFCELEFHQLQKSLATFHFVSGFCCQELLCDKLNDLKAKREAAKKAVRDAKKEEKNALRKRARLLKASHAPSTF